MGVEPTIERLKRRCGSPLPGAMALFFCGAKLATAQGSVADYERAVQFLPEAAQKLAVGTTVRPQWLENDRFWFRSQRLNGHEFIWVDPAAGARRPAFDHARLARALGEATEALFEAYRLPFDSIEYELEGRSIQFDTRSHGSWSCDLETYRCRARPRLPDKPVDAVESPDKEWAAYSRDGNLWVRRRSTGEEIRLSGDGEPVYGYAVQGEGPSTIARAQNDRLPHPGIVRRPVLSWSPDSRKLAVRRLDERGINELYVLEASEGRPIAHSYRYVLPGDKVIPRYEVYIFDVPSGTRVAWNRGLVETPLTPAYWAGYGWTWLGGQWGKTGREFLHTIRSRGHRRMELVAVDAGTGKTRTILTETSKTFLDPSWRRGHRIEAVVGNDRDLLWMSDRSGWRHVYRYDLQTGELRNPVTTGSWFVEEVLSVDEKEGWVYLTGRGREAGRNPYFRHLYRVRFDGSGLQLLTSEDADHEVTLSPSGRYVIDTYGRPEVAPITVLRRKDGRVLRTLEKGDVSKLRELGWPWPEQFRVKARNGVTDLYGLLYRPSNFDPKRRYPIVDLIYPGPQLGAVSNYGFAVRPPQALAELGFFVIQLDALGTPFRSKAFHEAWYGNLADNGIPDHMAALRELAGRHPQIDLDRVGIWGYSGGGFAAARAILLYPQFFRVAVSIAGNHDNRSFNYDWGETYHGLLTTDSAGIDSYASQANHLLADRLEGKLLLMYSTMDDNVHPNASWLLLQKLIEHNKDFDLVVLPNRNHYFADEPYVIRRSWDYLVRHLLGVEPPKAFSMRPSARAPAASPASKADHPEIPSNIAGI